MAAPIRINLRELRKLADGDAPFCKEASQTHPSVACASLGAGSVETRGSHGSFAAQRTLAQDDNQTARVRADGLPAASLAAWRACANPRCLLSSPPNRFAPRGRAPDRGGAGHSGAVPLSLAERPECADADRGAWIGRVERIAIHAGNRAERFG